MNYLDFVAVVGFGQQTERQRSRKTTPDRSLLSLNQLTEKYRVSLLSAITFLNPYGAAQLSQGAIKLWTQDKIKDKETLIKVT